MRQVAQGSHDLGAEHDGGIDVAGRLAGEPDVQLDVALEPERFRDLFIKPLPHRSANILIFPSLHAANAPFRLARVIGNGSAIGPMLLGLRRPANVLPQGSTESEIINLMAVTAYNAVRRRNEIAKGRNTRVWMPGATSMEVSERESGVR